MKKTASLIDVVFLLTNVIYDFSANKCASQNIHASVVQQSATAFAVIYICRRGAATVFCYTNRNLCFLLVIKLIDNMDIIDFIYLSIISIKIYLYKNYRYL